MKKNYLTLHLSELEEQQQTKLKVSWIKETTQIRVLKKKIETGKAIKKLKKTKSWFFLKKDKTKLTNI